jgi:2-polyprenyl-3-methyl-5-hydroxy-6-metoxy-1,4-benzoquinol methylase
LTRDELDALQRLLGRGSGRCLDVGCGTGVSTAAVAELGWSVGGIEELGDQEYPYVVALRARR